MWEDILCQEKPHCIYASMVYITENEFERPENQWNFKKNFWMRKIIFNYFIWMKYKIIYLNEVMWLKYDYDDEKYKLIYMDEVLY